MSFSQESLDTVIYSLEDILREIQTYHDPVVKMLRCETASNMFDSGISPSMEYGLKGFSYGYGKFIGAIGEFEYPVPKEWLTENMYNELYRKYYDANQA